MVTEAPRFAYPFEKQESILCPYEGFKDVWFMHDTATGFWLPVKDGFGHGQNPGIDYDVMEGTPVLALADGMVVRAGFENPKNEKQGFGIRVKQLVSLPGYDSWILIYGHLQQATVRIGQRVKAGDRVGYSGSTGATDRPLFHVELMDLKGQYQEIKFN